MSVWARSDRNVRLQVIPHTFFSVVLRAAGFDVDLEFGLAIPHLGDGKNSCERVQATAMLLATCMLAAQLILFGFSPRSTAPDSWVDRGVDIACVTFCITMHAVAPDFWRLAQQHPFWQKGHAPGDVHNSATALLRISYSYQG